MPFRPSPVKPPLIGPRHTGQTPLMRSVPLEARMRVADVAGVAGGRWSWAWRCR